MAARMVRVAASREHCEPRYSFPIALCRGGRPATIVWRQRMTQSMARNRWKLAAGAAMVGFAVLALLLAVRAPRRSGSPALPAEPLTFAELLEPSSRGLGPSPRLISLRGKRVRLVGFMAHMEEPPKGGFFLCAAPVFADEGGGGTADLPPDAVFVVVRSARGKELANFRRALEVVGVLELGSKVDEAGHVSRIRILLDGPAEEGSALAALREKAPQTSVSKSSSNSPNPMEVNP